MPGGGHKTNWRRMRQKGGAIKKLSKRGGGYQKIVGAEGGATFFWIFKNIAPPSHTFDHSLKRRG